MGELRARRPLERRDVQAARVYASKHVPDRAVLAGRIERLEDQEHGIAAIGVEPVLRVAERLHFVLEQILEATVLAVGVRLRRRAVHVE